VRRRTLASQILGEARRLLLAGLFVGVIASRWLTNGWLRCCSG
jgi:hypothetical protein